MAQEFCVIVRVKTNGVVRLHRAAQNPNTNTWTPVASRDPIDLNVKSSTADDWRSALRALLKK